MNRLRKLSVVGFVIAVMALCVAAGGLLTMYGLRLSPDSILPQPVEFALLVTGVMLAMSIVGLGLSGGAWGGGSSVMMRSPESLPTSNGPKTKASWLRDLLLSDSEHLRATNRRLWITQSTIGTALIVMALMLAATPMRICWDMLSTTVVDIADVFGVRYRSIGFGIMISISVVLTIRVGHLFWRRARVDNLAK